MPITRNEGSLKCIQKNVNNIEVEAILIVYTMSPFLCANLKVEDAHILYYCSNNVKKSRETWNSSVKLRQYQTAWLKLFPNKKYNPSAFLKFNLKIQINKIILNLNEATSN